MKKNQIQLSENELRALIKEAVHTQLNEGPWSDRWNKFKQGAKDFGNWLTYGNNYRHHANAYDSDPDEEDEALWDDETNDWRRDANGQYIHYPSAQYDDDLPPYDPDRDGVIEPATDPLDHGVFGHANPASGPGEPYEYNPNPHHHTHDVDNDGSNPATNVPDDDDLPLYNPDEDGVIEGGIAPESNPQSQPSDTTQDGEEASNDGQDGGNTVNPSQQPTAPSANPQPQPSAPQPTYQRQHPNGQQFSQQNEEVITNYIQPAYNTSWKSYQALYESLTPLENLVKLGPEMYNHVALQQGKQKEYATMINNINQSITQIKTVVGPTLRDIHRNMKNILYANGIRNRQDYEHYGMEESKVRKIIHNSLQKILRENLTRKH